MKRTLIAFALTLLAGTAAWSQENMVTLAGGYAFPMLR